MTIPATPLADQTDWQPPSEFDQIRELNSQGGRLAAVYGLLLTAYTFSVGSDLIKPIFFVDLYYLRFTFAADVVLFNSVLALGVLGFGVMYALATMQPPVPSIQQREAYIALRNRKLTTASLSANLVLVGILALVAIWFAASARFPPPQPNAPPVQHTSNVFVDVLLPGAAVLLTLASLAAAVRVFIHQRARPLSADSIVASDFVPNQLHLVLSLDELATIAAALRTVDQTELAERLDAIPRRIKPAP